VVQAGHAVAEWLLYDRQWANETLVYLGVKDKEESVYGQLFMAHLYF